MSANDLKIESDFLSDSEIINCIKTVKVVKILQNNTVLGEIQRKSKKVEK